MTLTLKFQGQFEIALSQEWDSQLTWNERGCELSICDHDIELCVTMVESVDVPDSNRGDFRQRCAINIYSWDCYSGALFILSQVTAFHLMIRHP